MRRLLFLLIMLLGTLPALAQRVPLALDMPVPGVTAYRDAIPTPEAVIGHVVGTRHTTPSQLVDYFRAVGAVSDRVVVRQHGRTHEGRPLIHAVVTSPENHARLDAIQAANQRLSDAPGAVRDADLAGMPAVVLMGYSIHGNEASGSEAALLLLYHLAAGDGPAVDEVLRNTVVLIDPSFNPDGRDRFADWVNRNRGAVPTADPQDREHNEPWPGGRTNHYWFDLNRDWMPAQHPESQGRLALFHTWRPQVLTDYHEMGGDATFFFQPGIPSRNNPNTPARTFALTGEIATYHARALDRLGSLYYTEESFDDFYYGKGSTYPDVNGAVGILFEQASSRALLTETVNGLLSYAFTVRNQFAASLSTLEAVVALREKLLRHQRDFYAEAPDVARQSAAKAYVVGYGADRTRAQALAQLLQRHRIRLYALGRDVEALGGGRIEAGDGFVVPVDQPQARLIKGIMERTLEYQDSLFYDVSAWTLPLAFGVPHAELRQVPSGTLGAELGAVAFDGGAVVGGRSGYAYVMPWGRYFAPRALYRLQQAGIRPRLMSDPFSAPTPQGAVAFARGAVVIPVVQADVDAETVHRVVAEAAREDHVVFYAVTGGLTPEGPDLGSRGQTVLEKPRIALLTGPGTDSNNAGEAWHLLSERFRLPVSLLDVSDVGGADLRRYNVIVMAGGSYGGLPADALKGWVRGGGRVVGIEGGASWLVRNGLAELEAKDVDLDSLFTDVPYAALPDAFGAQQIGGAILEARLDPTHPLAYGYGARLPIFRSGTTFFKPPKAPGTAVGVYTGQPLLSGYLSSVRRRQAEGAAALVAQRYGRGRVILMADNPNFRAFWYGTNGLFLNALFLGGAF